MKRVLLLLTSALLLSLLAACNKEPAEPQPSTSQTSTTEPQSDMPIQTSPPLIPAASSAIASTPGPLTNEQAKILAADLAARAWDIEVIFAGDSALKYGPVNEYSHRSVIENPFGIHDIASLKDYTERTFTGGFAQPAYYQDRLGFDGVEICGNYYELDGMLYSAGGGMSGDYPGIVAQTAEIQSQTDDTITLEMEIIGYNSDEVAGKITWRLKWEGGAWKLDCNLYGLEVPQYWSEPSS